ncbi:MAG: DUF4112 domain-containing protein [Verrucomicrobiales bacterium]
MPDRSSPAIPDPTPDDQDLAAARRNRTGTSRRVSWLLDECVRVPGTSIRFGLDPILGLLPFGGETIATIIGAAILKDAGEKGLPLKTIVRMSGNMIVNAGVGAIPGVGDLFSVWFKSNSRNYRMLNAYLDSDEGTQAAGGWWPVTVIGVIVALVLLLNILAGIAFVFIAVWIYRQISA